MLKTSERAKEKIQNQCTVTIVCLFSEWELRHHALFVRIEFGKLLRFGDQKTGATYKGNLEHKAIEEEIGRLEQDWRLKHYSKGLLQTQYRIINFEDSSSCRVEKS